jgi:hypothetical protein
MAGNLDSYSIRGQGGKSGGNETVHWYGEAPTDAANAGIGKKTGSA